MKKVISLKTHLLRTALFYPLEFCSYVNQSCKYFNSQYENKKRGERHGCLVSPECFWKEKLKAKEKDDESSC